MRTPSSGRSATSDRRRDCCTCHPLGQAGDVQPSSGELGHATEAETGEADRTDCRAPLEVGGTALESLERRSY